MMNTLDTLGLTDSTLVIRTADHGEMGLAHGGLRQKDFDSYEESLRVPPVYSNPKMFPTAVTTQALVSPVDFLPTLATLVNAPTSAKSPWQGIDYSRIVLKPTAAPGQTAPYKLPPNHVVSVREARYKIAEYYDATGKVPSQWEMYDLTADPNETANLAATGYKRNLTQQADYTQLKALLATVQKTRLQPLGIGPASSAGALSPRGRLRIIVNIGKRAGRARKPYRAR